MTEQTPLINKFQGFPSGVTFLTEFPEAFFTELLPEIDDINELKITLYTFWYIQQLDNDIRFMKLSEIRKDKILKKALTIRTEPESFFKILDIILDKAVVRGTLLMFQDQRTDDRYYFINTPRAKALLIEYQKGYWNTETSKQQPIGLDLSKPDIFKVYEQNIGLITPMIAEQLKTTSEEYPLDWIVDAIRIAVENNKRRLSYINGILASWQEKGRNGKYR